MNGVSKVPLSEVAELFTLRARTLSKTEGKYPEQRIIEILYFCKALAEAASGHQQDFAGRRLFEQHELAAWECDNVHDSCVLYLSLALSAGHHFGVTADKLRQYDIPTGMVEEASWLSLNNGESILAWNLRVNKHQSILYPAESLVKQKLRIDNVFEVNDHHRHNYHGLVDMLVDIHSNPLYQFGKINRHIEIASSIHVMLGYSGFGTITVATDVKENKVINILTACRRDGSEAIHLADMSMELFTDSKEFALIVTTPSQALNEIVKPSVVRSRYDYEDVKARRILEVYASRFQVYNNNL